MISPSRSSRLIAAMHHAALTALAASPNGQLHKDQIVQAIESTVALDEWACVVYDNGNTRWRSIFAFASVGLVKGGYVTKLRGVWAITDEGRAVAKRLTTAPRFWPSWAAATKRGRVANWPRSTVLRSH
ncbi:winged helix-turn-helix domain-containing protein [Limnohabitans sp. DCL3]|uniref:winged helix-turn-helix domain-containing protein n=1 Tax=Limnohabitans sp. DCL3 TaxID=3374103 RepID=UPI003A8A38CE